MVWDPVATGDRSRLAISTMADMAALGTGCGVVVPRWTQHDPTANKSARLIFSGWVPIGHLSVGKETSDPIADGPQIFINLHSRSDAVGPKGVSDETCRTM